MAIFEILVSSESTFKADKSFFFIGLANRGLNRFQSWIKTRDSSRFATHCLKCKKKYVSGVLKERTPEIASLYSAKSACRYCVCMIQLLLS